MSESGLQAVTNSSELFLSEQYSDSEVLAGLAVAAIMDGSRTFLIEIQVNSFVFFPQPGERGDLIYWVNFY